MTIKNLEDKLIFFCETNNISYKKDYYPRSHSKKQLVYCYKLKPKNPFAKILIVHGAGNDGLFPFLLLFYELLKNNIEINSFDLDGHGKNSTSYFCQQNTLNCINDAIEYFNLKNNTLPTFILGHSLGGALTLNFLAKNKHPFLSAIIVSTPIDVKISLKILQTEVLGLKRRSFQDMISLYGIYNLIPPLGFIRRKEYPIRFLEKKSSIGYIATLKNFISKLKLDEKVRNIEIPIFFIYGSSDYLSTLEDGKKLSQLSKNSKLLTLNEETHYTTILSQKAIKEILAWIKKQLT